ncbi:hypothetical protein Emin_1458 [Elusimicrobium minutum Pei191]|uniref:Uncharacterized protein n=1 Tax=Elusimicrobium minutum (strain Pei191) TaxID=445932 RepID=B2KER0_ELUMP|nr:hypothetical protein [Elusimicrobium minutum]ACC99006.1 hypothetical protein Emin_1458 [Elusimicrobium minutum Pei191]
MKDNFSFFDHIGTGNGLETIGDQMRREKRVINYEKRNTTISLLTLIVAVITLIVVIIK